MYADDTVIFGIDATDFQNKFDVRGKIQNNVYFCCYVDKFSKNIYCD